MPDDNEDQPTPAPGYPTPELELAPAADPDREAKINDAVRRLARLNGQLEMFNAARRIAFDGSLVSFAAVKQIRALYENFDQKHPTPKGEQL